MTGELAAKRATIADALRAGGVATPVPGEPWAPPCAIVRPGSPWLAPARIGPKATRAIRINALLVAGAADNLAALGELETLAERAVLALSGLPGWTTPSVTAARAVDVFGSIMLGAEVELETIVTLTASP
jgi:hypothetical protein